MTGTTNTVDYTRKTRIGELFVQRGFLSDAQLSQALDYQKKHASGKPLGEICVEIGFIPRGRLNVILEKYHKQILLGDLFPSLGIVSESQINEALEEQRRTKKRLGEVLIEKGFISKPQLVNALSIQLGIPKIVPNVKDIEQYLLDKVTPAFLQKNRVVPLWYDEQKSAVVMLMDDPLDTAVIMDIEKVLGSNILPAVSATIDVNDFLVEVLDSWSKYHGMTVPVFDEGGTKDSNGSLPSFPAINVDFGHHDVGDESTLRPQTDSVATHSPLGAGHMRLPSRRPIEVSSRSREHLRATETDTIDLKVMDGKNIELAPATKDMIVDTIDSSSVVAKDNATAILNFIVFSAVEDRASDIHIEPFEDRVRVRFRVDGVLRHKTYLPKSISAALSSRIKALSKLDIAERRRHQDGRIEAKIDNKNIDLRVSTYASLWGENVVIRLLNRETSLVALNSLGLSPLNYIHYKRLLKNPAGIILVTGPTGSGKTTTLYASLIHLNDGDKKIITVEDPIEYTIDGVVQGRLDSRPDLNYDDFIKSMMRQDPDVIMIGEIRDEAGAAASIQASLTGHKVFTSFHTEDVVSAILRLINMGIEPFLISSTVSGILSQRLARTLCPFCKEPIIPDESLIGRFTSINAGDSYGSYSFYKAVGCSECNGTGYKGRTGVHELLEINRPMKEAILSRATAGQLRLVARETARFISMAEDGFYKAASGITTLEDIIRVVSIDDIDEAIPYDINDLMEFCDGTKNDDGKINMIPNKLAKGVETAA